MYLEIREFRVKYVDENGVEGVDTFKVERPYNPIEVWKEKFPNRRPTEMKRINMDIDALLEDFERVYREAEEKKLAKQSKA